MSCKAACCLPTSLGRQTAVCHSLIPTVYRALLKSAVSGTDHRIHTTKESAACHGVTLAHERLAPKPICCKCCQAKERPSAGTRAATTHTALCNSTSLKSDVSRSACAISAPGKQDRISLASCGIHLLSAGSLVALQHRLHKSWQQIRQVIDVLTWNRLAREAIWQPGSRSA